MSETSLGADGAVGKMDSLGIEVLLPRVSSSVSSIAREGERILPKSCKGKTIAVFTSGGDSQGQFFSPLLSASFFAAGRHPVSVLVPPRG